MRVLWCSVAIWMLLAVFGARGVEAAPLPVPDRQRTPIPLTAFDAPFNVTSGWPSMRQSLDLGYATTRLPVWGIRRGFARVRNEDLATGLGIGTVYALAYPLGLIGGWAHEEWHRAVMSRRGISSRNGIFYASAWSEGLISVDRVTDEDLARLKRDHPAESVRLMSAGLEAQQQLGRRIGDDSFVYSAYGRQRGPVYFSRTWMFPLLQINFLNQMVYHATCSNPGNDDLTDSQNRRTLTVESRDFTGLDCVAFAWELHRPDTPYADRGPHPYGNGIDRYRSWSDLDGTERRFVRTQLGLHFLNLLDPHLYGIDGFAFGRGAEQRWLVQAGHMLTPYGYAIETRVSLLMGPLAGFFALEHGINGQSWFPGVRGQFVGLPLGRAPLSMDAVLGAWLQPKDLRYDTKRVAPGGNVGATLHWHIVPAASFDLELEGKSAGFVPGNVYLDPNLSVRVGATLRL